MAHENAAGRLKRVQPAGRRRRSEVPLMHRRTRPRSSMVSTSENDAGGFWRESAMR